MEHQKIPFAERMKGIPGIFGIRLSDQPAHQIVEKDGAVEIRVYEPMTVARLSMDCDFETFRQEAFLTLADYVFGLNDEEEEIGMMSPVLIERAIHYWTMSFVLPGEFNQEFAPRPKDLTIQIVDWPERTFASLSYHGNHTLEKMDEKSDQLLRWVSSDNLYKNFGTPLYAQYDGQTTLPFIRKNEVWIEMKPVQ